MRQICCINDLHIPHLVQRKYHFFYFPTHALKCGFFRGERNLLNAADPFHGAAVILKPFQVFRHQPQRGLQLFPADLSLRDIPCQKIRITPQDGEGRPEVVGKRGVQFLLPLHKPPHFLLVTAQLQPHGFHGITEHSQLVPAVIGHMEIQVISAYFFHAVFQDRQGARKPFSVK